MLTRLVTAALAAAIVAGLSSSLIQAFTTTPMIIQAEQYEGGGHAAGFGSFHLAHHTDQGTGVARPPLVLTDAGEAVDEWAPEDGLERTLFTSLAATGTYFGLALVLLGAMILANARIDARQGLIWGAAAFAATGLAPALGLSPELPGAAAADLAARQYWWLGTVIATAAGLFLALRVSTIWAIGLGIALMAAPHVIGAPHPEAFTSQVPSELSGHFAAASLVVSAIGWALAGSVAGYTWQRLAAKEQDPAYG